MSKTVVKLDWCSHEAARYAVETWHYSKAMPVGKMVRLGVWEDQMFVGVLIFSWGANCHMAGVFGLLMTECAELVRVALDKHKTPVSRLMSIACKMLCKQSPGLKLLVSYADPYHDHHGGIYQAAGWLYLGTTKPEIRYLHNGRMLMRRGYTGTVFGKPKAKLPVGAKQIEVPGKHKYVLPLTDSMHQALLDSVKPYPKRVESVASGTPAVQAGGGGANPTSTLHSSVQPQA